MATTIGTQNPFRYRGYYYDFESGFYYLNSRYYDPDVGRFINADTTDVLDVDQDSMIENNLFAYCLNNPITRADDDGDLWHIAIGVAIGAGVSIAGQLLSGKSLKSLDWIDIASSGISGGLAATGVGLVGQIVGNSAISMVAHIASQGKNKARVTAKGLVKSGVVGGISGAIGGKGANGKAIMATYKAAKKHKKRCSTD